MKRVAIIVADEFEDTEFQVPFERLKQAGYDVSILGAEAGKALHGKKGKAVDIDLEIGNASPEMFDAVVIPGGHSPDKLRMDPLMVAFTRGMAEAGKPIAAICHGGSMLIEAGVVDGRTVTSWPSIKTDLINAGAQWVDREVVEDGNFITSRKPSDVNVFCAALMRQLALAQTGRHRGRRAA